MATSIGKTGTDLQIAIEEWLLDSGVRVRAGSHKGAIAGWLNEDGQPDFVYPEITGYYLSWLSFLARTRQHLNVTGIATEAVHWLDSITRGNSPPATRFYFDGRTDWRNDAVFTFDLAMICRGLRTVRGLVPEETRTRVLHRLLRYLLPQGSVFPVAILLRRELPDRWSTRPGPFQLKTAAALLGLLDHPAVWGTFDRWNGYVLAASDSADLHATFYALEGLMQFAVWGKPEALRDVATCFEVLFPNIDDDRSDVIAQGLRLGCALRSFGLLQNPQWADRLAELSVRLEAFVTESGAVSFRFPQHRPRHANTWSAIFAHQSLIHYYARATGKERP